MTAIQLVPANADRDTWLAARSAGIGASEIAAVLGLSPYDSPFSLYWKKVHGWEIEDTGDMEAGRRMETAIAEWAADRIDPNEQFSILPGGLYRSEDRPWQLATPDRVVYESCVDCSLDGFPGCYHCNYSGYTKTLAVLECKHPYSWDGFGEDGTDEIPVYFRTQLLQQMDVMEVGEGYLAAYCGHELRVFRVRRDDKDIAVMRSAGAAFWQRLQDGVVPGVDEHQATATALRRLHPTVQDVDVQVPVDLAEGYRRARALRARAELVVDRYEARIRDAIGDGRRAMCGTKLVASRSVYDQSGDTAELGALDDEWPTVNRLNPGRSASYV